jgi:Uma2 family endonuclease
MAFTQPPREPFSNWFVTRPPDVVVEVLDREADAEPMHARAERLFRFGVPLFWLVCCLSFTVTVIRPGRPVPILACGDTLANFPELPGFSATVASLFTLPGQQPPTAPTAP